MFAVEAGESRETAMSNPHLQSFVPKHRFESPYEALDRDPEGACVGRHASPAQCARIIAAIHGGNHTASKILAACEDVSGLGLTNTKTVLARLRSMALHGILAVYVQPLRANTHRWCWYLDLDQDHECPEGMLTLGAANHRLGRDDAEEVETLAWI